MNPQYQDVGTHRPPRQTRPPRPRRKTRARLKNRLSQSLRVPGPLPDPPACRRSCEAPSRYPQGRQARAGRRRSAPPRTRTRLPIPGTARSLDRAAEAEPGGRDKPSAEEAPGNAARATHYAAPRNSRPCAPMQAWRATRDFLTEKNIGPTSSNRLLGVGALLRPTTTPPPCPSSNPTITLSNPRRAIACRQTFSSVCRRWADSSGQRRELVPGRTAAANAQSSFAQQAQQRNTEAETAAPRRCGHVRCHSAGVRVKTTRS